MDLDLARDESVVVAEFGGLRDLGGEPVRFTVRRHPVRGTWVVDLSPYLLGAARPADVRALAEGILATLERGAGEPDFTLFDDGYAEALMTVGYDGDELYFTAGVAFDPAQDAVGSSPGGEPLYRNRFGTAYLEFQDVAPADPSHLMSCARALLAVLGTQGLRQDVSS
ncbi:hypothetical protein AB0Q95_10160 [Streptomyces sp. NPDC059900]|uniref:hypothetical protein n=1 Tax=Streptomyces sp. NPDC059900 TaxID=3155816 RepID=UPI0034439A1A